MKKITGMITKALNSHMHTAKSLLDAQVDLIEDIASRLTKVIETGHSVYLCGNGGSAADAEHFASELVGRLQMDRPPWPVVALTTNPSLLTSLGNDYGFQSIFSKQVQAFVRKGDALIGMSTSGNSVNVVGAVALAREMGAVTIGMTGADGGQLARIVDVCLQAPGETTQRVQEAHQLCGHIICEIVESVIASKGRSK